MLEIQGIINNPDIKKNCQFFTYACLQQPQTLDYLKYLKLSDDTDGICLNFNSQSDDSNKNIKKSKKFMFDGYYNRKQKLKYQFANIIQQVTHNALNGQNQTLFVYGTQEKCKDRIFFGQSQNPGLFLCILSQIFQQCHRRALQDDVTIKFSCSMFNKGKFLDILGGNKQFEVQFAQDLIQGGVLHNIPEIIIRNVKTCLKLLNIMLKHVYDARQQQFTENLILTLKLQLDCKKIQDETQVYCISKINFVKLANPSINSSLKGINKHNIWFVNFINFIQERSISGVHEEVKSNQTNLDEFTVYLRQTYFKSSHKIFGFVSITNKMSSNQCLSALLFSNHLKNCKTSSQFFILDIISLSSQRNKLLQMILNEVRNSANLITYWTQYVGYLQNYMNQMNLLQFEYSLVIGQACERLGKYIFTQELQDFFYAKKISVQASQDLQQSYMGVKKQKTNIMSVRKKIIQQINGKIDEKILQRFFNLQFSLAHHFLIQDLSKLEERLSVFTSAISLNKTKNINQSIIQKNKEDKNQQKQKLNKQQRSKTLSNQNQKPKQKNIKEQKKITQKSIHQTSVIIRNTKKITSSSIDYLQSMFRNKNVGNSKKRDINVL